MTHCMWLHVFFRGVKASSEGSMAESRHSINLYALSAQICYSALAAQEFFSALIATGFHCTDCANILRRTASANRSCSAQLDRE